MDLMEKWQFIICQIIINNNYVFKLWSFSQLIIDPYLFFGNELYAAKFYGDKIRAKLHTPVDKMK